MKPPKYFYFRVKTDSKATKIILEDASDCDVVEVVRCRECKHSLGYKFPYNYERVLACNDPRGMTIKAVSPMHFCSYGERKEGGQEK